MILHFTFNWLLVLKLKNTFNLCITSANVKKGEFDWKFRKNFRKACKIRIFGQTSPKTLQTSIFRAQWKNEFSGKVTESLQMIGFEGLKTNSFQEEAVSLLPLQHHISQRFLLSFDMVWNCKGLLNHLRIHFDSRWDGESISS